MILACVMPFLANAQVSFSGNAKPVWHDTPDKSTGLNTIYVLRETQGVQMHYTSKSGANVEWYKFGVGGGSSIEEIPGIIKSGNTYTLNEIIPNMGYKIVEGTTPIFVWVINYNDYALQMSENALNIPAEQDCGTATIYVNGSGKDIIYYTINGVPQTLSRKMKLSYTQLEWQDAKEESSYLGDWVQKDAETIFDSFKNVIVIPDPLCGTAFSLSGDQFLEFWGEGIATGYVNYMSKSVDVRTEAVQEPKKEGQEGLGGSAPLLITFKAYPSDEVVYAEWQMSRDPEFKDLELRLSKLEHGEVFVEAGTTYWRFIGSDSSGDCEVYSDTYTVTIGTSKLECPNAFSPGVTEGVNDVWKVSYQSIVDFHCWIFNRYGTQMCEFTDPAQGWDGKRGGKVVPSGVYYYVIEAVGADGVVDKKSGDINIIGVSDNYQPGTTGGGTVEQ